MVGLIFSSTIYLDGKCELESNCITGPRMTIPVVELKGETHH
jgi:hypothetical protein